MQCNASSLRHIALVLAARSPLLVGLRAGDVAKHQLMPHGRGARPDRVRARADGVRALATGCEQVLRRGADREATGGLRRAPDLVVRGRSSRTRSAGNLDLDLLAKG